MSTPVVIDRATIMAELRAMFPEAAVYALDADYNVVSREAIRGFSRELEVELRKDGIYGWDPSFDCEDFCDLGRTLAKRKHIRAKRTGTAVAQGVAVGMLCYPINGEILRGHAVMIFRTRKGWEAYEPQNRQFITLNQMEKKWAWLLLI